jgi:hypothetical protein
MRMGTGFVAHEELYRDSQVAGDCAQPIYTSARVNAKARL